MSWLTAEGIKGLGFAHVGKDVLLSSKASYYNPQNIFIDDCSRIDDFCVLSAGDKGIFIGRNVHIAIYSSLIGQGKIAIDNFSNLSSRVSIYSSNDDYSGAAMTNPTVPHQFTNVYHSDVHLGKHVIIGSGSVVLPGVTLGDGVAIGALSLVRKDCEPFTIYAGSPLKRIKSRDRKLLKIEEQFLHFSK